MVPTRTGPLLRSPAMGLSGALAALSLAACAGNETPNHPPTATLDPGFVQGDTVSYALSISWSGSDPDGRIVRFEVAIDPPSAFSEEEIANGGPGITVEEIPAAGGSTAKTRVSKTTGEGTASFDWVHTEATSRDFTFSTTRGDSAGPDTARVPTGRFYGMHALYLRAVDDDGAVSVPDHVAFTSRTVAPTGRITSPRPTEPILGVGLRLRVNWSAEDPDGPAPVRALYKLVPLTGVSSLDVFQVADLSPYLSSPDQEWTPIAAGSVELELIDQTLYVLAVRAVDEAGAADPFLERGRNVIVVRASRTMGPGLVVDGPIVGSYRFPRNGRDVPGFPPERPAVPYGIPVSFRWSASAESYGGEVAAYGWGLDVIDPEGEEGWGPWGSRTGVSFIPPSAGAHAMSVRALDIGGGVTRTTIPFDVIEITLDREALYVDDFPDKTTPRPSQHADFWRALFQSYADNSDWDVSAFSEFHAWGEMDDQFVPSRLPLSDLGRYKLLIWNCDGRGVGNITSLFESASIRPTLALYLRAGGKLWVSGKATATAMTPSPNGVTGDPAYPKTSISSGRFIYDFLKLHTTRIDNDRGADDKNTLLGAWPYPGKPAIYDTLMVDPNKLSATALGSGRGVPDGDVITDPMFVDSEAGFRGTMDSLCVYRAAGPILGTGASTYDRRLNGVRWSDPDPDRQQGRVQWFGFPLYYFRDDQARDVFRRSLDWFREETPGEATLDRGTQASR